MVTSFEFSNHYAIIGSTTDFLYDSISNSNWNRARSLFLSVDKLGYTIDTSQYNYYDSLVFQYYPPLKSFDLFTSSIIANQYIYAFGSKLSINSINKGKNSVRVAKLDSLGNLHWDKFITMPNDSSIEPVGFTSKYYESENRIVVLCDVYDANYGYEYPMIMELDTSGNVTKQIRILNQGKTYLRSIAKDSIGNYYCGGFKGLVLPNVTPKTMKIDSLGNILWNYLYTFNSNSNRNTDMILTNNNLLVSVVSEALASNRFLYHLQKMDLSGNQIWDKVFAYSRQLDNSVLYEMPNTNIAHVCMVRDTVGNPPVGQRLTMFDSSGVELWYRVFYSSDYNRLYDLKPTSDGGFIMCGDHGSFQDPVSGYYLNHAWVLKTDSLGLVTSLNEVEENLLSKVEFKNPYPNPVQNELTIETFIPLAFKQSQLHLFDMQSRELKTIQLNKGLNKTKIDLSQFACGNYLIALSVDGLAAGAKRIIKVE